MIKTINILIIFILSITVLIVSFIFGVGLGWIIDKETMITIISPTWMKILEILFAFLGVLAGAIVSIFVFWKGKRVDEEKENNRLDTLELFVKTYIRNLSTSIEKQIGYTATDVKKLEDIKDHDYMFLTSSSLHTNGINWITPGELHTVFVLRKRGDENEKIEIFREFNSKCDIISNMDKSYESITKYFRVKYEQYEKLWDVDLNKIRNNIDFLMIESERNAQQGKKLEYPFFDSFYKIYKSWSLQEDRTERLVIAEHLLKPLATACKEASGDHYALENLHLATNCLFILDNINALKAFTILNFKSILEDLESANRRLLEIMRIYDVTFVTNKPTRETLLKTIFD